MASIKAENYQVKNLFKNGPYDVPLFQRSYSWSVKQAETLLNDITDIIDTDEVHFIGSMIFSPDKSRTKLKILDGQQRFSTIILLLASLKDSLYDIKSSNSAYREDKLISGRIGKIEEKIFSDDEYTQQANFIISLNKKDRELFKKIMRKDGFTEEKKYVTGCIESHKNIFKNYLFFYEYFTTKLEALTSSFEIEKYCVALIKTINENLNYIDIFVEEAIDANKIFESINHKGVKLSEADLIKNYIFSEIDSSSSNEKDSLLEIQINKWDDVADSGINIVSFLRHYWLSKFTNSLSKKDLYDNIKNHIKDFGIDDLIDFLEKVYDSAEAYKNFKSPTQSFWKNKEIKEQLNNLEYLGTEQTYIILLAGYEEYFKNGDENSFLKLIKIIEPYIFRRNTILHKDAKSLETLYAKIAKGIRNSNIDIEIDDNEVHKINSISDIEAIFKLYMPTDEEILINFKDFTIKDSKLSKYILCRIYEQELYDIRLDSDYYDLEHIIPQQYEKDEDWMRIDSQVGDNDKKLRNYINFLGNMTLLLPKDNRTVKNKGFSIKKSDCYNVSTLLGNRKLGEYENFSIEEVLDRQKMLGKEIVKIWKL